jgi:hypothetical protein
MSKQQKSAHTYTATLKDNHQSDTSASFVALNNRTQSYAAHCPVTVEDSEVFQVRSVTSSYLHSYDSIRKTFTQIACFSPVHTKQDSFMIDRLLKRPPIQPTLHIIQEYH